jgi:DNA-nicking Smr family endonuclease
MSADVVTRLRRGHWAIQAQIDLHGLRRDEAREQLAAFVRDAHSAASAACAWCTARAWARPAASRCSRRRCSAGWRSATEVIAFTQASGPQGGAGALVVLLERRGAAR